MTPKHGDKRYHGTSTEPLGAAGSVTSSVHSQWCAICEVWVETVGVFGGLRFLADHDHPELLARKEVSGGS